MLLVLRGAAVTLSDFGGPLSGCDEPVFPKTSTRRGLWPYLSPSRDPRDHLQRVGSEFAGGQCLGSTLSAKRRHGQAGLALVSAS